jgi:hypothetical protein
MHHLAGQPLYSGRTDRRKVGRSFAGEGVLADAGNGAERGTFALRRPNILRAMTERRCPFRTNENETIDDSVHAPSTTMPRAPIAAVGICRTIMICDYPI